MTPTDATTTALLARGLFERFPAEAALDLEAAETEQSVALLAASPPAAAARVLHAVTPLVAARLLEALAPEAAGAVLAALDADRAATLLRLLEPEARGRVLEHVRRPLAKELAGLVEYPEDSAGSLMDPQVLAFRPETTAGVALERLRDLPHKRTSEVYLVEDDGTLLGAVPLRELAVAPPETAVRELLGQRPVAVQAMSSRNEVMDALAEAKDAGVVVIDMQQRLLGAIRRDALVQAAQDVASADAQAMVGASKEERALSRPLFVVRKRLPWLAINLGTSFLAAAVVGIFESTIAKFTALAVLLPVVAGQSGNTGAQALAVTMRGLALREVRTRHALAVCLKELKASFANGVAIALITSGAVLIWNKSVGLAMVIGVSMVLSMMAAGLAGAAIPMLLTALRQDPAQSSSIVLTTVTDIVGFLSFLGIATAFASML